MLQKSLDSLELVLKKAVLFLGLLIGFRKFIIMFLMIAISLGLLLTHRLTGALFVDLLKSTLIAYFASNGVENFASAAKSWITTLKTDIKS